MNDLEKILSAAKEVGDKLQSQIDELTTENKKLRETNENVLGEIEKLRAENEKLRVANETFGNNLNSLMTRLNQTVNENHEKFVEQINNSMRDEFKNFLTDCMNEIRRDENISSDLAKKNSPTNEEKSLTISDVLPAERNSEKKTKPTYAAFYAEEIGFEQDDTIVIDGGKNLEVSQKS